MRRFGVLLHHGPVELQFGHNSVPPVSASEGSTSLAAAAAAPHLTQAPPRCSNYDAAPARPARARRDLTHLSYLNEPGILHVLRQRYGDDAVYTMAGAPALAAATCRRLPRAPVHTCSGAVRSPAAALPCRPRAGGGEPLQAAATVRPRRRSPVQPAQPGQPGGGGGGGGGVGAPRLPHCRPRLQAGVARAGRGAAC